MKQQSELNRALSDDPQTVLSRLRWHCRRDNPGDGTGYSLCEIIRDLYANNRPDMKSSDPRDRIYALLNLSTERDSLRIVPDYSDSLTPDLLYTRVARSIIQSNSAGIQLLQLVEFPKVIMGNGNATERLPSWVPDFFGHRDSIAVPWAESSNGGLAPRVWR